jgi:hypothetical protein
VLYPKVFEHLNGKGYFLHGISFIIVKTAFESCYFNTIYPSENQLPMVAFHGGNREIWNISIINAVFNFYVADEIPEARAKYDAYLGFE